MRRLFFWRQTGKERWTTEQTLRCRLVAWSASAALWLRFFERGLSHVLHIQTLCVLVCGIITVSLKVSVSQLPAEKAEWCGKGDGRFQSGVCQFGAFNRMIPGGWGDYRPEHKSQQSLNVKALQEKSLRPPNRAEAPPVKAAGAGGLSLTFCCSWHLRTHLTH